MVDLVAVSRRVADTLDRSAPLKAMVSTVGWGKRPRYTYGGPFPEVRVAPSRAPVARRQALGTGAGPDRLPPQLTQAGIEVAIATESESFAEEAEEAAWRIAALVESALAQNARLADADGGDHLVNSLELGTVAQVPDTVGKARVALTVMVTVQVIEDLVLNTDVPAEGA